ncbi:MAG: hypothetical protein ABIB04_02090 [Patescibacteria group bacterium]
MYKKNIRVSFFKMTICVFSILVWFISASESAKAETFIFKNSAQDTVETARIIKDPQNAKKIFGRLETKDDVDYFTFKAEEGQEISVSLSVPAADQDFKPNLIIFGQDLPKSAIDPVISIGDTNGAYVLEFAKTKIQTSFNNFLLTSFNLGPRLEFSSPKQTSYGLAIRSPDGKTGRYLLKIGQKDTWLWNEILDRFFGVLQAILRLY